MEGTEMGVAVAGYPDDRADTSLARKETLRRAEEALQRANQWADWMEAARAAELRSHVMA